MISAAVWGQEEKGLHADAPVVLFLHGYGSDERDLAGLSTYLPDGVAWVSVRAPLRHPSWGYSWYPLTVPGAPAHHEIDEATAALWAWADDHLPADIPIIPVGFSQGGLMASQLLRTRPERVPRAAILSGYVQDHPQPGDAVLAVQRPPVLWCRGQADEVIPSFAVAYANQWLPEHSTLESHVYPHLGHSVNEDGLRRLHAFLAG